MEEFVKRLQKRVRLNVFLIVITAICVGTGSTLCSFQLGDDPLKRTLQFGLFLAMEGFLLFRIIFLWQTLKSTSRVKALYIKEQKTMQEVRIFNIELLVLALAAILFGFLNAVVFYTLLGVTGFVLVYRILFELWYQIQKEK